MTRKTIAALCTVVLAMSTAVGCGGNNTTVANNEENNENAEPADAGTDAADDPDMGGGDAGDSCEEGQTQCAPDGCVDTQTSMAHCGECDSACAGGPNTVAMCVGGGCDVMCEAGYSDIDGDLDDPAGNGCEVECEVTNDGNEICDGVDNDCNGVVDDGFDVGSACSAGVGACEVMGQRVCNAAGDDTECDATPGTPGDETCGDGIDNDCDGEVDEDDAPDAVTWYFDNDGDGYGSDNNTTMACAQPVGYVADAGDCNDGDENVNPMATELCDNVDNDCDTDTDEDFADKGMNCTVGEGVCQNSGTYVCNQAGDATVCSAMAGMPQEQEESVCDGQDNDCDGVVDDGCDDDMDGWCDTDFQVFGTTSLCNDGANTGDCDDNDDAVYPGAPGACDGKDNDCNGTVDDVAPVDTGVATFHNYTNVSDTSLGDGYPSNVLVEPSNGGFCIVMYDDTDDEFIFSHLAPDGTFEETTFTPGVGDRRLVDIAATGTYCGIVYRFSGNVHMLRWEYGTTTVTPFYNFNDGDTFASAGSDDVLNATINTHTRPGIIVDRTVWGVGYLREDGTTYDFVYRWLPLTASDSTNRSASIQIDGFIPGQGDVAFGPSPNSNDDFAATWVDGTNIRVASIDGANVSTQSGLTKSGVNAVRPHLFTADGNVNLLWTDLDQNRVRVQRMENNYSYSRAGSFASSNLAADQPGYMNRTVWSEGLTGNNSWLIDPAEDKLYRFFPDGNIIADFYTFSEYDHPAFTGGFLNLRRHLMAARTDGDVLSILQRTPTTGATVQVSQFTCY